MHYRIALISIHTLLGEDAMALGEVEQRPRRDRDDQLVGERRLGHPRILAPPRCAGYGGAQKTVPSSSQPSARIRAASVGSTTQRWRVRVTSVPGEKKRTTGGVPAPQTPADGGSV